MTPHLYTAPAPAGEPGGLPPPPPPPNSMLHERLTALVLLAFEKDIRDKVCKDKRKLLRMFDRMAVRRLPLF